MNGGEEKSRGGEKAKKWEGRGEENDHNHHFVVVDEKEQGEGDLQTSGVVGEACLAIIW